MFSWIINVEKNNSWISEHQELLPRRKWFLVFKHKDLNEAGRVKTINLIIFSIRIQKRILFLS